MLHHMAGISNIIFKIVKTTIGLIQPRITLDMREMIKLTTTLCI